MSVVYRIQLLTLVTFLLAGSPAMAGDMASDLPASLADSLRAITEVNLDDMDKQARDSIQIARRQLNEVLQAQPVQSDNVTLFRQLTKLCPALCNTKQIYSNYCHGIFSDCGS